VNNQLTIVQAMQNIANAAGVSMNDINTTSACFCNASIGPLDLDYEEDYYKKWNGDDFTRYLGSLNDIKIYLKYTRPDSNLIIDGEGSLNINLYKYALTMTRLSINEYSKKEIRIVSGDIVKLKLMMHDEIESNPDYKMDVDIDTAVTEILLKDLEK